jgi:hypothetical protein
VPYIVMLLPLSAPDVPAAHPMHNHAARTAANHVFMRSLTAKTKPKRGGPRKKTILACRAQATATRDGCIYRPLIRRPE